MSELDTLRAEILRIDEAMLDLWQRRNTTARRIGELKRDAGQPLQNYEVEKSVLDHALAAAKAHHLPPAAVRSFIRLLLETSLAAQERDRAQAAPRVGRTALVIGGAGPMGTWFCRFLEEQGFGVFVEDPRPSAFPASNASGGRHDLVLVATPPSVVPAVLEEVGPDLDPSTLLADIASIKGDSVPVLRALAATGKKVASLHPMFGPSVDVLMGRNVLVLDCGHAGAVKEARGLFAHTAAQTHVLPLELHDELMAEVLGLSHAASLAFNQSLVSGPFSFHDLETVASTTFRKQVDVSREVARENPRLYFEIQALNAKSLPMLRRLEESAANLRRIVERGDRLAFVDLMHRAHAYYEGGRPRSRS